MICLRYIVYWGLMVICMFASGPANGLESGSASPGGSIQPTSTLSIVNQWSGDFPVVALNRLPEGQQTSPAGIITSPETFSSVWQAFQPGAPTPEIDFHTNFIVFVRNVAFYNRTRIGSVVLTNDVANIIAMETLSATPIDDTVAMALAEIPRAGVRAVRVGHRLIPLQTDPSNTSYLIEGKLVELINGRSEREAAPGSDSKIITAVLGSPAVGDLNSDERPDAAVILFQNGGGSGSFIYVAAAIKQKDGYHGTNAMFLGDRITIDQLSIRKGKIRVQYRDRRPEEPMAIKPTVPRSFCLIVQDGELHAVRPTGEETPGLKDG